MDDIHIVIGVILARKKLSGSSGLKWNFVIITNGNQSEKKEKQLKRRFRIIGNIFKRLKIMKKITR